MTQRLDAKERTRREIKVWVCQHGLPRYLVDVMGAFTLEELLDISRDAIKEGVENRLSRIEKYGEQASEALLRENA
jgi:hypothetical protein